MKRSTFFHLILLMVGGISPVKRQEFATCEIKQVLDGDTVHVSRGDSRIKARLVYIDSLEVDQIKGQDLAKSFLQTFKRKKLNCHFVQRGFYGRWLAEIYSGETSLNFLMIKKGLSFLYPYSIFKTESEKYRYLAFFQSAKSKKLGIFKAKKITSPWNFRKKKRRRNKKKRNK